MVRYIHAAILSMLLLVALTFANISYADMLPPTDAAIEKELEGLLNESDYEASLVRLLELHESTSEQTPVMTRIRLLGYIASNHHYNKRPEQAQDYLQQMKALAQRSGLPDALAETGGTEIYILLLDNKVSEALAILNDALVPVEQATMPRVKYFVHNLAAYVYSARSQFAAALEHLIYALDAISGTNTERTILRQASLKLRIANIYNQQKSYDLALEQLDDLEVRTAELPNAKAYLVEVTFQRGVIETARENYDAALAHYAQVKKLIADDPDYQSTYLTVLNNIGDIDMKVRDFAGARQAFDEAYAIAKLNNDEFNETIIRFNLGFIEVYEGDYANGLSKMLEIVELARAEWAPVETEALLGEYAEALGIAGNYQEKAAILLEQRELRDQIYKAEQQKSVAELQNLYDSKDKAQQILLLEQKNELNQQLIQNQEQKRTILLLLVVVALFGAVLVFMLYRSARRSNQELKVANVKLAEQSIRDPLTGLLNRRALQNKLNDQHDAQGDAMILLDIDHFKRINDNLGHTVGDDVLLEVSKRLLEVSRDSDLVVRWGGEEFLIYLSSTEQKRLPALTARLLAAISEKPIQSGDKELHVTATAGFICYPFADLNENQMDWEDTLQLADMVLYAGKVHGRNQAWGVMALNVPFAEAQPLLETDLPAAIDQGMLSVEVVHGPKVPSYKA
ncbi:diguanylate cyclase [Pseudidiomarina sp. PP-1MA]|uniref:diguanylate cyclase n=1 Tax=Pseudidiomarina sp. PP-1MA TaxID=3237706 RepID=A0AB39XA84_9GAMM